MNKTPENPTTDGRAYFEGRQERSDDSEIPEPNFISKYQKWKCEGNAKSILRNSYSVRLILSALENAGCSFDMKRHICCEPCDPRVNGGYDGEYNQVVLCQNSLTSAPLLENTMAHELLHMFDYCVNKMDPLNDRHLACTEIRAANLTGCTFLPYATGSANFFSIRNRQKECVRQKAARSVAAVRDMPEEEAYKIVDEVFPKCYSDLEPLGRQAKKKAKDHKDSFDDRRTYGYYSSKYL